MDQTWPKDSIETGHCKNIKSTNICRRKGYVRPPTKGPPQKTGEFTPSLTWLKLGQKKVPLKDITKTSNLPTFAVGKDMLDPSQSDPLKNG